MVQLFWIINGLAIPKKDEYFFESFFTVFCCLFVNTKVNFLLSSTKSFIICEKFFQQHSSTLQEACSAFLIAACDSKSSSVSRPWMYTGENWPMRAEQRKDGPVLMRLSENLEKCSVFLKKQAGTLYLFFSWTRQAKHLKTICACTERQELILKALKNIHLVTQSLFSLLRILREDGFQKTGARSAHHGRTDLQGYTIGKKKAGALCAATSLDGGRWRCSCSPSSFSPASTSWLRPYPLTPEETEIPKPWGGIFKQSMGARNQVGMGFSYRPARLRRLAESISGLHRS
jgi:hypothetical protein